MTPFEWCLRAWLGAWRAAGDSPGSRGDPCRSAIFPGAATFWAAACFGKKQARVVAGCGGVCGVGRPHAPRENDPSLPSRSASVLPGHSVFHVMATLSLCSRFGGCSSSWGLRWAGNLDQFLMTDERLVAAPAYVVLTPTEVGWELPDTGDNLGEEPSRTWRGGKKKKRAGSYRV